MEFLVVGADTPLPLLELLHFLRHFFFCFGGSPLLIILKNQPSGVKGAPAIPTPPASMRTSKIKNGRRGVELGVPLGQGL